ncbi:MAG: SDR family oxidoreductase [Bacteroidota bacterium]
MDINLQGKKAFVCGSTQGIGRATAVELASLGAEIVLVARNESMLQEVVKELPAAASQDHQYLVADFTQPELLREVIDNFLADATPIHILINNTGGPPGGPITEATSEQFLRAFQMHLLCNQILAQAVLPGMKKVGYGRIIQIISTSVKEPIPGLGVSNTTRGAVNSWAMTLAVEVAPFGITVNNVLPGFTKTTRLFDLIKVRAKEAGISYEDMTQQWEQSIPAARFADPEETAAAIAFLASPSAAYINGVNLPVDGGRLKSF